MYSLNVPVPGQVAMLASEIARELPEAHARERGHHTLGVKRLNTGDDPTYGHVEASVREILAGQQTFDVRIVDVDYFTEAVTGSSPVVHLVVESPELRRLHLRLAERFAPVDGIEGEGYSPHVTVARGGSLERAKEVTDREIETIEWTVSKLAFWNATKKQPVSTVSLPA